jgi:hypothetical protein
MEAPCRTVDRFSRRELLVKVFRKRRRHLRSTVIAHLFAQTLGSDDVFLGTIRALAQARPAHGATNIAPHRQTNLQNQSLGTVFVLKGERRR